ncbi:unnamed protein product [Paramecium sonneborni]|uniref:Uncharacterized protein n=1 Tax=Paramecium sonneborni TaxID=65129 RepID=A0A8S1RKK0_9CILI|nr:unnamed protein product [Paramecium sonneborni]
MEESQMYINRVLNLISQFVFGDKSVEYVIDKQEKRLKDIQLPINNKLLCLEWDILLLLKNMIHQKEIINIFWNKNAANIPSA